MFQTSQESMVPKSASPEAALARAPGMFSNSQRSFKPEK